jgi:hypothetical protein
MALAPFGSGRCEIEHAAPDRVTTYKSKAIAVKYHKYLFLNDIFSRAIIG